MGFAMRGLRFRRRDRGRRGIGSTQRDSARLMGVWGVVRWRDCVPGSFEGGGAGWPF